MQQVQAVIARAKGAPVEVVTINVPDPGGPLSAATDAYDLFATEIAAHFAPPQRAIS